MNQVYLAIITKAGKPAYQFVCFDNADRASYLAGAVMDALCDYHGGDDWWYEISALPYMTAMTAERELREHALSKALI